MQGILGKAILCAQRRESCLPSLWVRPWQSSRYLPGRVGLHPAQTRLPCGEHGIVELTRCFQVCAQAFGLACLHLEGQFEQKRGRVLFGLLALFGSLCAHQPHTFSYASTSIPSIPGCTTSVKRLSAE